MVCNMVQQKEDGLMAECRKKNGDGFMAEYRKKKAKRRISSVEEREELLLTVDRTEGTVAVCEAEDGSRLELPVTVFEGRPQDGMIVRWNTEKAVPDPEATEERRRQMQERLLKLQKKQKAAGHSH